MFPKTKLRNHAYLNNDPDFDSLDQEIALRHDSSPVSSVDTDYQRYLTNAKASFERFERDLAEGLRLQAKRDRQRIDEKIDSLL